MSRSVSFTVYGIPAPQAGTRAVMTAKGARQISSGGKGLADWRNAVASSAAEMRARLGASFDGPVGVQAVFRLPMPKSRSKRIRDYGEKRHTGRPDVDKLARALLDSLTAGGLITDDARVCDLAVQKFEIWDDWTGVAVLVRELAERVTISEHEAKP